MCVITVNYNSLRPLLVQCDVCMIIMGLHNAWMASELLLISLAFTAIFMGKGIRQIASFVKVSYDHPESSLVIHMYLLNRCKCTHIALRDGRLSAAGDSCICVCIYQQSVSHAVSESYSQ